MKLTIARAAVTETLPVRVDPYGMRPRRLANRMLLTEEEKRQHERDICVAVRSDVREHDFAPQVQHDGLETRSEPARRPPNFLMPARVHCCGEQRQATQNGGEQKHDGVLGRRHIYA